MAFIRYELDTEYSAIIREVASELGVTPTTYARMVLLQALRPRVDATRRAQEQAVARAAGDAAKKPKKLTKAEMEDMDAASTMPVQESPQRVLHRMRYMEAIKLAQSKGDDAVPAKEREWCVWFEHLTNMPEAERYIWEDL